LNRHHCLQSAVIKNIKLDFLGNLDQNPRDYNIIKEKFSLREDKIIRTSNITNYAQYFTDSQHEAIRERFKEDVSLFNYKDVNDKGE